MPPRNNPPDEATPLEGVVVRDILADAAPLPRELQGLFTLTAWRDSLIKGEPYKEVDPDFLSRKLMLQTLNSATLEDVFEQKGMRKLQEAIPNTPGAGTGNIAITELYVTDSDFGEGAPCYVIFGAVDMDSGALVQYTTGATQLQIQMLRALSFGHWPIRGNIKRIDRKDKGGRYLFWMFPPD